jgi:hypothetical protein
MLSDMDFYIFILTRHKFTVQYCCLEAAVSKEVYLQLRAWFFIHRLVKL